MCTQFFIYADKQVEQFYQANEYFKQEKFEDAVLEYEGLEKKGPVTWYNIGICYLKQENNLDAFIAFKRAEKMAQPSLLKQINKAINKISKKVPSVKEQEFLYYLRIYGSYLSLFWLQLAFLILWFLLFTSLFFKEKFSFYLRVIFLFFLLFVGSSLVAIWLMRTTHTGIVVTQESLYSGPNKEYHVIGKLHPFDQITLLDSKESWYKVKNSLVKGWVKEEAFKQV